VSLTRRTPAGAIRSDQVGREVDVYGWVHRRRDLGGLIFIDLRDRSGIVQVKLDPVNVQAHAAGGEEPKTRSFRPVTSRSRRAPSPF